MLTSRLPHDDVLWRVQSSQIHTLDSTTTNGHLGCTTHTSSDIYPNPANLCWRVVYGGAVDFVFFSPCHSRTAARNTRQTPRMQPQNQVSLHVYKHTARWSSQSRQEVMLSSRRTSPRGIYWTPSTWKSARWSSQSRPEVIWSCRRTSPRGIYWTPSTRKYQACYCCQNISSLLSVWLSLVYCWATVTPSSPHEAMLSPHLNLSISKRDVYSYFISFCLADG